ncbi:MAG: transporter permease [Subtercola sp.]|jgi:peptide/nickel transport system permease protein|nr:transporter permease [Subtercola sp.]
MTTATRPLGASVTGLSDADATWVSGSTRGRMVATLRTWRRAILSPSVAFPLAVFLIVVIACFAGPEILNLPSPIVGNLNDTLLPPGSPGYPLGTNELGNDELSRLLWGGQISIIVGLGATAFGLIVGSFLGMLAAYSGRAVEVVIMRLFDALLAFPGLILALILADFLGPNVWNTILAIGIFGIARFGRLAWAQTIGVRHRDFVVAARSDGVPSGSIVLGHMVPNVMPTLLGFALFTVGTAMTIEAGLSFLGLGVQQPQPTWGNMIAGAQQYMSLAPWLLILPAAMLVITILSLNLVADSLRIRLDEER